MSTESSVLRSTDSIVADAKAAQGRAVGDSILRLGHSINGIMVAFQTWRRNRKAMQELAKCSDWMLADIGIRRDQIRRAVTEGKELHEVFAGNPVVRAAQPTEANDDLAARKIA